MATKDNNYWIKLYHEILRDPKMGRLPDHLWRRTIELFLLAGELHEDGQLPETGDIAWALHQPEETLEKELSSLAGVGIVEKTQDGWLIVNFAKRQAPISRADIQKRYRERKRAEASAESGKPQKKEEKQPSVTSGNADTDTDKDKDKDKRHGGKPPPVSRKTKKPRRQKNKEPPPPAICVYRSIAHRYPDKAAWPMVIKAVGEKQEDLDFWAEVIESYIACGWNKINLKGMVQFYNDRRIPTTEPVRNGANNGKTPPISRKGTNRQAGQDTPDLSATFRARARGPGS